MAANARKKQDPLDAESAGAPDQSGQANGQSRTPRRVFKRPIGILGAGKYRVVQALQLSEGGVVFIGDELVKPAEQVVVSLCLPSGGVIVARGEISDIEVNPSKAGARVTLKFMPLSLQVRRSIRNYVTAKTQAEAELESGRGESQKRSRVQTPGS